MFFFITVIHILFIVLSLFASFPFVFLYINSLNA